ncbi:MAG: thioredoxin domain-containing protein [Patescibacteria group bacterium]
MDENIKKAEDKIQELSRQVEELKKSVSSNSVIPLPIAIVIAGVIVAGSVMYASINYKNGLTASVNNPANNAVAVNAQNGVPSTPEDHVFGNPNAPIKIVEYSDLECPFCKMFHQTMAQIMEEYGKTNKVAWIYRHFPLDQLHSKARNEARATECAWEQGGNDAFWKFVDKIFEITPSNDGLDPAELPQIAQTIGIDKTKFISCLSSDRNDARITQNEKDGLSSGAQGTPFSIIFTAKGKQLIVNGAQPYENVKKLIDQALAE